MNAATLVTVEDILDRTRTDDPTDYAEWGRRAGAELARFPEQAVVVLVEAMTARARHRVTREASRTRDGVARIVADAATGQITIWSESTDATWLRTTGLRLVREGRAKIALGQLLQQAADCVDAHPGLNAREAWAASGLDVAVIDAAEAEVAAG